MTMSFNDSEAGVTFSKKKRRWKKTIIFLAVLAAIIIAESVFDIFEIAGGRLLLLTNPLRPQTGRLWDEDHKEKLGIDELESLAGKPEVNEPLQQPLRSVEELEAVLSMRSSLSMNRDEFKTFYTALPIHQAKKVLDPLNLLELDRNAEWQRTQLSLVGDQLVVYFLDGYDKPIQESHVQLHDSDELAELSSDVILNDMEAFRDRIVPAAVFYQAFDRLERSYRLQIVNDPYKLVQWGNSLQRVAISPFISDDGVEIVFEVRTENGVVLQSMNASEIAAGYLIQEINSIADSPQLKAQEKKDEDDKNDH